MTAHCEWCPFPGWQAWDKSGLDVEVRLGCGQVALSDQPCDVCRQARKDRQ